VLFISEPMAEINIAMWSAVRGNCRGRSCILLPHSDRPLGGSIPIPLVSLADRV